MSGKIEEGGSVPQLKIVSINDLKVEIKSLISQNGNHAITGEVMQKVLLDFVGLMESAFDNAQGSVMYASGNGSLSSSENVKVEQDARLSVVGNIAATDTVTANNLKANENVLSYGVMARAGSFTEGVVLGEYDKGSQGFILMNDKKSPTTVYKVEIDNGQLVVSPYEATEDPKPESPKE